MDKPDRQRASASYVPAELDTKFLLGDSMRGVRLQLEFAKAEESLQKWGIRSTVVVFGSSRVLPSATWYDETRRLANIVAQRGGSLNPVAGMKDNVIATGGGPGLMEAANRGAFEIGAPSIGFNIQLPDVQEPNPYTTPELTFQFRSFAVRKMHLAMRANALVAFPGGFGTLDELFEILTLVQTKKMSPIPIICFDSNYWKRLVDFGFLKEQGMITSAESTHLVFADDAEQAWDHLAAALLRRLD